mmetsp:Transcript_29057/g.68712  ORF Transcript_29057/g.68712 Transcript_29057/m.68712 type:complete len:347 (+) Transcript_29057:194-1234(+)
MEEDPRKEVLNRSRRDRLTKAAKQGYGPWADPNPRSRLAESSSRARETFAAVSEDAPRAPLMRQQRRSGFRKALEDEPDLDSFLASKPPGAAQKKAQGHTVSIQALASKQVPPPPTKVELHIPSGTNERSLAASAGARPKAAARALSTSASGEQAVAKPAEDFEPRQRSARMPSKGCVSSSSPSSEEEDDDAREHLDTSHRRSEQQDQSEDERDRSREERRHRQREEKRKREEWRKSWREEKKRRERDSSEPSVSRRRDEDEDSDSDDPGRSRETSENKNRALTWSALNSFGVTTARDAQKKYVGQVSDADLDRRIREQDVEGRGVKLMSEAEVLAKMQKTRGKRR